MSCLWTGCPHAAHLQLHSFQQPSSGRYRPLFPTLFLNLILNWTQIQSQVASHHLQSLNSGFLDFIYTLCCSFSIPPYLILHIPNCPFFASCFTLLLICLLSDDLLLTLHHYCHVPLRHSIKKQSGRSYFRSPMFGKLRSRSFFSIYSTALGDWQSGHSDRHKTLNKNTLFWEKKAKLSLLFAQLIVGATQSSRKNLAVYLDWTKVHWKVGVYDFFLFWWYFDEYTVCSTCVYRMFTHDQL